jgi:ribosomal protein S6
MKDTEINDMEEKDLNDTQIYEIGYHLLPTVAEENIAGEVSVLHEIIKKAGGTIISEGAPYLRNLAYDMTKRVETKNLSFSKAYFGWIKFELDTSAIVDVQKSVENLPNVLRSLVIKTIRENTLFIPKAPVFKKEEIVEEVIVETPAEPKGKEEVSEAEIDKSIDELLVDENSKLKIEN